MDKLSQRLSEEVVCAAEWSAFVLSVSYDFFSSLAVYLDALYAHQQVTLTYPHVTFTGSTIS